MRRAQRACLILLASTISAWVFLCAVIGIFAAEIALHPQRRALGVADEELAASIARQDSATLQSASIVAQDGVVLSGWVMRPTSGRNGDAVILLHGVSDNRAGMLGNADMLLRHGFEVLLPDARAHGRSGGAIATYGVLEREDIARWVEWLRSGGANRCVDGLGDSMGAAQLLQSIGSQTHFCAVVAESPFANFREASFDRMGQQLGVGPWAGKTILRPAVDIGLLYAEIRYGVRLLGASPEETVSTATTPVLLIHGLQDDNLPPRHSEMIFAMSRTSNVRVELWEPLRAGHCGAASANPEEYERRVLGRFASHEAPGAPQVLSTRN